LTGGETVTGGLLVVVEPPEVLEPPADPLLCELLEVVLRDVGRCEVVELLEVPELDEPVAFVDPAVSFATGLWGPAVVGTTAAAGGATAAGAPGVV
jgi:hypothetical protein